VRRGARWRAVATLTAQEAAARIKVGKIALYKGHPAIVLSCLTAGLGMTPADDVMPVGLSLLMGITIGPAAGAMVDLTMPKVLPTWSLPE
jgi:hypothetical protein